MLAVAHGLVALASHKTHLQALGFAPRALILWWSQQGALGHRWGNRGGIGFATGRGAAAVGWASDDAADPTRVRQWTRDRAVIGAADGSDTAPMEASISFTDDGFAIDRDSDTDAGNGWLVHYLAIGGEALVDAAVARLTADKAGSHSVRGLGFRPDCIVVAPTGFDAPRAASGLFAAIGAATEDCQATTGFTSLDAASPSNVRGCQRRDAMLAVPLEESSTAAVASLRSMDTDGFTIDWNPCRQVAVEAIVLALRGGRYAVGSSSSPIDSRTRRSVDVGFRPAGVLAFGWGLEASNRTMDIGRLSLGAGAASPFRFGAVSWADMNGGARPSRTQVRCSGTALHEVPDTRSDELHARARLLGFHPRGFLLDWTISDHRPREFAYLAFGSDDHRNRAGSGSTSRVVRRAGSLLGRRFG